jgi:hypothetical protein
MYWAVLYQILIVGFFLTKVSTVKAVRPLMSIGQGCSNNITDAMNGTNATELPTFANDRRRKEVSHRIAKAAKATRPFQFVEDESVGRTHAWTNKTQAAAIVTTATRA